MLWPGLASLWLPGHGGACSPGLLVGAAIYPLFYLRATKTLRSSAVRFRPEISEHLLPKNPSLSHSCSHLHINIHCIRIYWGVSSLIKIVWKVEWFVTFQLMFPAHSLQHMKAAWFVLLLITSAVFTAILLHWPAQDAAQQGGIEALWRGQSSFHLSDGDFVLGGGAEQWESTRYRTEKVCGVHHTRSSCKHTGTWFRWGLRLKNSSILTFIGI